MGKVIRGKLVIAELTDSNERLNTFDCDDFFPTGGDYSILETITLEKLKQIIEIQKKAIEYSRQQIDIDCNEFAMMKMDTSVKRIIHVIDNIEHTQKQVEEIEKDTNENK